LSGEERKLTLHSTEQDIGHAGMLRKTRYEQAKNTAKKTTAKTILKPTAKAHQNSTKKTLAKTQTQLKKILPQKLKKIPPLKEEEKKKSHPPKIMNG